MRKYFILIFIALTILFSITTNYTQASYLKNPDLENKLITLYKQIEDKYPDNKARIHKLEDLQNEIIELENKYKGKLTPKDKELLKRLHEHIIARIGEYKHNRATTLIGEIPKNTQWKTYTNSEYNFTLKYPSKAYYHYTCNQKSLSKLIELKIVQEDNTFQIKYSKMIDRGQNCKLVDDNRSISDTPTMYFKVLDVNSKQELLETYFDSDKCKITNTGFPETNNMEKFDIEMKPEYRDYLKTQKDRDYWICSSASQYYFDKDTHKGLGVYLGQEESIFKYFSYNLNKISGESYSSQIMDTFHFDT